MSDPPINSDIIAMRACNAAAGTPSDFSHETKPLMFPGPTMPSLPRPCTTKQVPKAMTENEKGEFEQRRRRGNEEIPQAHGAEVNAKFSSGRGMNRAFASTISRRAASSACSNEVYFLP